MKAVLVIDVPDGIDLSLLKGAVQVTSKDDRKLFMFGTYRDLELRPLPKKKYADFPNNYEYGYADGYNTCLLELGETE